MKKETVDVDLFQQSLNDEGLIEIVRAKQTNDVVSSALKELSRRKSRVRFDIFGEILSDENQSVQAKNIVINELGAAATPENQRRLLENITTKEVPVRLKIVQALGKIGDPEALKQLERVLTIDDVAFNQELSFARSLISYRHHLNKYLLELPSIPVSKVAAKEPGFSVKKAKKETVQKALTYLKKALPALPLTAAGATSIICQNNELFLVFSEEFQKPESFENLKKVNAIPLVLLRESYSIDGYFPANYFFTHPSEKKNECTLIGTTSSGQVAYTGSLKVSERQIKIEVKSLKTVYAPAIDVQCTFDLNSQSFKFTKMAADTTVAGGKESMKIPQKASFRSQ